MLLPVDDSKSVLALGMTAEEITVLSRSYHHIDVLPSAHRYKIIIIGKEIVDDASTGNYLSCLADEGTLVVVGSGNIRREIKRKGLICLGDYAALPPKQPRLFIPLTSKKIREIGISFHSPGSRRSKLWLSLARKLNAIGIIEHLRRNTVSFWSNSVNFSNKNTIKNWISERVGWEVIDLIIYAGSDAVDRKITALAISSDCNKKVIARIADTDLGTLAIKRESEALKRLAQSSINNLVPSLIAEDKYGPYFIQLQSCFPKSAGQCRKLSNLHIRFLAELSKINRIKTPVNQTAEWKMLSAPLELPDTINNMATNLVKNGVAGKIVECHMSHGDFVPWNIICEQNGILVYDWENSNPTGFPFHDVFHFIYRQAALVGPWPGSLALLKAMRKSAACLAHESKIIFEPVLALSLWCIKEYLCKPDSRLIELAIELNRTKNE
ncbi:MAG: hypothetical protein BWZ05_02259 [Bacteroidetes bacterium ADurb.BinA245]|nr:MAG: hypothetical protein BWZ05_02259 [Bacteroidetes bacterium ADurb.BinA245]